MNNNIIYLALLISLFACNYEKIASGFMPCRRDDAGTQNNTSEKTKTVIFK
jgi:hypothetical protein